MKNILPIANTGRHPVQGQDQTLSERHVIYTRQTDNKLQTFQQQERPTTSPSPIVVPPEQKFSDANALRDALEKLPAAATTYQSYPHSEQLLDRQQLTNLGAIGERTTTSKSEQLKKPGFSTQTWFLISLLLVVLLIGSGAAGILYTSMSVKRTGQTIANPPPQPTNAPVTTSATTIAPTPGTVYPPTGTPALNDPLTTNQLNWDEGTACNFVDGSYQIISPTNQSATCYAHNTDYHNFIYQVQMTFVKTGQRFSAGGIAFRGDETTGTTYYIEIFESGKYSFIYKANTQATPTVITGYPQNQQSIPSFHTDLGQANTLTVVAQNNEFSFYVNNQLVFGPIKDTTSSRGMLGIFAAGGQGENNTQVTFSNALLWELN